MNERIKELIDQAAPDSGDTVAGQTCHIVSVQELGKFAELLIKECIDRCKEVEQINMDCIVTNHIDPELGPRDCINVIKKHFGID